VIGWPRTENGIGEDVRVGFDALTSQGLDAIIVDASLRAPPAPQQKDLGYDQYTRDAPVFNTDIVYLDAATQFRYYFHDFMNSRDISGRRIIAVSPWELARWPEDLGFALDHVDEFWAASRFIFDAFSPYFGRDAIHLAPPAVVVPEAELDEFDFSKIDEPLVFLTTFDGLSSIHRKNPFAAVKAFVAAFPIEKFGDVRLIVKTMNFSERNPQLRELGRLIASDSRISLINRAMPKGELFDLVRSAHCFISLHRSEGFGRNIAEMMLFRRPVVVSNYSGNVDFCFESNSFLADGALVDVGANQYTFSQGQQWFDVAIESAVDSLRKVYLDRDLAAKKADCGRAWIRERHSLNAVGLRYRELIEAG
jgi:glycosyltransferase involved in cell wall biosynthesis